MPLVTATALLEVWLNRVRGDEYFNGEYLNGLKERGAGEEASDLTGGVEEEGGIMR